MSELGLGTDQPARRSTTRRGRGCIPALLALVLIVALGIFAYVKGVELIKDKLSGPEDYSGTGHGSVVIEVRANQTATDIAGTLYRADVVKSEQAFIDAAKSNPESTSIQVGYYALHKQMSGRSALGLLLDPAARVSNSLTIPEGKRAQEILALVADKTDFSGRDVSTAFDHTSGLGLPSYADGDAEGYLFPATYDVTPHLTAAALLTTMVDTFKQQAGKLGLEAKARRLGVSPHDVVVTASLVQAEASRQQDMPKVASVIYNRLDQQMPLQLDSTLHYAVESRGEISSGKLLGLDSPYNTYKRRGLPPTAIDSPGAQALQAALNPADTKDLFFVTVNLKTGETKFAQTYGQHLQNVAEYRRYCTTSDAC